MPMFPDSGVPAGEAKNTIDVNTVTPCDELWYSTSRCQPRFDPAAANAMLAEDMNLIMKGEVVYDCLKLDNIERAVRYINQRGLPRGCFMAGGPSAYTGVLDPPCTRYNDYMTLTVIPAANCGAVGVTFDAGRGPAPLLRNDGMPLERDDLKTGKPAIIAFYAGYWYLCGLASSQVPILIKGGIDCWIRTDGNDTFGDGTANTPDKAFKTIAGCWAAVGSRYAATPLFSINMKLGIPGDYDGAVVGPFGGNVSLTGDEANPGGYRILSTLPASSTAWGALWVQALVQMHIKGVTFLGVKSTAQGALSLLRDLGGSSVTCSNCRLVMDVENLNSIMIEVGYGSMFATAASTMPGSSTLSFIGNGTKVSSIIQLSPSSTMQAAFLDANQYSTYYFENIAVQGASFAVSDLSVMSWGGGPRLTISTANVTGTRYSVSNNSIINMNGKTPPGTIDGTPSSGGIYNP